MLNGTQGSHGSRCARELSTDVPEIARVRRVERMEQETRRLDRTRSDLGAGRYRKHGGSTNSRPRRGATRCATGCVRGGRRRLRRLGIRGDQGFRGPIDALDGARDEIAAVGGEVERLAGLRIAGVRHDRAVAEELETALQTAADGEVSLEEIAGPAITDRHAEAVAEVILGVSRDVDAVAPALGSTRRVHILDACSLAHGEEDVRCPAGGPNFRLAYVLTAS